LRDGGSAIGGQIQWFTASVRDIRMLRIEESNDLRSALIDEDEDGQEKE
jgi:virulence-associated protein VapD